MAKLTHEKKCAIYWFKAHGYSNENIARAFGVARTTVAKFNRNNPKYDDIHQEYIITDYDEFKRKYTTDEMERKVIAVKLKMRPNRNVAA